MVCWAETVSYTHLDVYKRQEEYAAMKKTEREAVWAQVDARMGEVLADAPALQEFLKFMSQCRN